VTKPFNIIELKARVRALLRRSSCEQTSEKHASISDTLSSTRKNVRPKKTASPLSSPPRCST
jgi:DNA-binding response OmpR family regulator